MTHTRIFRVETVTNNGFTPPKDFTPIDGTLCLRLHHEESGYKTTDIWINPDQLDHLALLVRDALDRRYTWGKETGWAASLKAVAMSVRPAMIPPDASPASPAD